MQFLVDANVLSEPTKDSPNVRVVQWLNRHETELAVNPIVLGELEYGILSLPASRRRNQLADWFSHGVGRLQVLDFDRDAAKIWAALLARLKRAGRAMPVKDSLICATALQHQLTVATRNTSDYRHAGVHLLNPFDA